RVPWPRCAGARWTHPDVHHGGESMSRPFAGLVMGAALAVGCVQQQASPTAKALTTLDVQLLDPPATGLGSAAVPGNVQKATFNIIAKDEEGNVVPQDLEVEVFISFGGVKTGAETGCGADDTGTAPIERLTLKGGMIMNHTVMLPAAFGSTSIWVDEP